MKIEFLWFDDCPNHHEARGLLRDIMLSRGIEEAAITEINVTDPSVAQQERFPGSPTIRINGKDVEPGYVDSGEYTPRCRLYLTDSGLKGVPEPRWIEDALRRAKSDDDV